MFGKQTQRNTESLPSIKVRVREQFVLHLWREEHRKEYFRAGETVVLTPKEVKQYQHMIEIEPVD